MRSEAQAVVIGGGVGGASIAYHLARLGWKDVVLVEQYDLTSRLDVALGGPRRPAALVGQPDADDHVLGRALCRAAPRDGARTPAGTRSAASASRRPPSGWRSSSGRPAGPRPTGCRSSSSPRPRRRSASRCSSPDGVLGAAWMPGDGYLDPSQLTYALADGARRGGAELVHPHPRHRHHVRDGRVHEVVTDRGTIAHETSSSHAGGMAAPVVARLVGVTVPIIPMRTSTSSPSRSTRRSSRFPTLRDPGRPLYFRPRSAAWSSAATRASPRRGTLDGIPAGFEAQLLTEDRDRFEESCRAPSGACRARAAPRSKASSTARRRSRPTASSSSARREVPRLLGRRRASAPTASPAPGGVGKVMAEWIVDGEPEYDLWHMDIRRFGAPLPLARYALARKALDAYSRYYDIVYPDEEREAGRPLRVSAAYPRLRRARRGVRREVRLGAGELVRAERGRGRRGAAPARLGRAHWSPAIGAECLATRDAAALFDQSSFAKLDVHGPGRRRVPRAGSARTTSTGRSAASSTPSCSTARGGIEADLTVTRLAEDRFRVVTGTAFGAHDLGWIRRHLPATARSTSTTSPRRAPASACGGRAAREILQPLTTTTSRTRPSAPDGARDRGRRRPRASRSASPSSASWAGSSTARRSTGWRSGTRSSRRARRTGCVPAATARSTRCAWRRATASGGSDITPETTPDEAGLGFAVRLDKPAGSSAARRCSPRARRAARPQRLRCLVLDDPRAVCLGNEPVRRRTASGRAASPRGGYGHRVAAAASPTPTCRPRLGARRPRSRSPSSAT